MDTKDKERFWEKVEIAGPNECWLWTGGFKSPGGYGTFYRDGKTQRAHRVSYELAHGPIPQQKRASCHGYCVCHSCDNPPCVNPAHLWLGSHLMNMTDARLKGRFPTRKLPAQPRPRRPRLYGEDRPGSKLTEDDVENIRVLHPTMSHRAIGELFMISHRQIGQIIRREKWKHI